MTVTDIRHREARSAVAIQNPLRPFPRLFSGAGAMNGPDPMHIEHLKAGSRYFGDNLLIKQAGVGRHDIKPPHAATLHFQRVTEYGQAQYSLEYKV
jgi:hypothetical protein